MSSPTDAPSSSSPVVPAELQAFAGVQPVLLPLTRGDVPVAGGKIGGAASDFVVDEVPQYLPSGEGPHWYVRVRKTDWNTQDVVRHLARAAGVRQPDVGCAGQKDRHAVTSQWFSVPEGGRPPEAWQLPVGVEVLEVSRHKNKLRTGHLRANRFSLRFVDMDPGLALARVDALARYGVLNGYGPQRFGWQGRNLQRALAWFVDGRGPRGDQARFDRKMLPSALQSELFNRYLLLRQDAGFAHLIEGEWVRLAGTGSHFRVEDLGAETPRYEAGDLVLCGTLPGGRQGHTIGHAHTLETAARDAIGFGEEAMARLAAEVPGAHRDLLLFPEDMRAELSNDQTVVVSFTLPAGAYATVVARELTGQPWNDLRVETPAATDGHGDDEPE